MLTRTHGTALAIIVAMGASACGVETKKNGKVQISSVSPDTSSITGGVEVQLSGKGFDDGSEPTVVFGTNEATVTSYSDATMSVILPAGSGCGNVDIQVNNSNGFTIEENAFNYTGGNSPLSVLSITPSLADLAGGTPVTIDGTGFTGGVGILMNGVPLEEITIISDTQATAVTPAVAQGGTVDVSIRNCSDEVTLSQGFTFTTGLNGLYVELPLIDLVNPAQFSGGASDFIDPFIAFVDPSTESLLNPVPTMNSCVFNQNNPAGSFTLLNAGNPVTLESGAQSIDVDFQAANDTYYIDGASTQTASFVFGGSYSVTAPGQEVPGFSVGNAVTAPTDFTVTSPNIGQSAPGPVEVTRGANQNWAWTGGTPGDFIQVIMVGYDNAANPTNQVLECFLTDDGNQQIPGADIGNFTAATTQMVVSVVRRKDTTFFLPPNGSNAVGVGLLYKRGVLCFPEANCS